jgi:hypothetical protein
MKNQRKKGGYTLKNKYKLNSNKSRSKRQTINNKVKINRKIPSNTVMNRTFLEIFK